MKSKDQFKERPKPPDRNQIVADLKTATDTDVVFTHALENPDSSIDDAGTNADTDQQSTGPDMTVVNTTYSQVTRLIQLQERLMKEPEYLDKQYAHLEQLGEGVSDSIDKLKAAAEDISASGVK